MENLTGDGEIGRPKYRVNSFTTSFEGESRDFILFTARLQGKLLYVEVSPSNFHNSPSAIKEFYKYFKVAASGLDALDDDLIYDFFDWALSPFLSAFQNHVPGLQAINKTTTTLQDFLYPETYDCELGAVNDNLIRGLFQRRDIEESYASFDFPDDFVQAMDKFQSVHPSQVEIYPQFPPDAHDAPDDQPSRVRVSGQTLFFKSAIETGPDSATKEVMKYLRIAELEADLRTSRLYGIVQDDKDPPIGLLFHYIDEESSLAWAVGPETSASLKDRWSAQVTNTLMALHKAGVVWGDVKASNVLIDKDNNAWIIDFGGGYTEGWVDREKAGTIEGDLQGLANIMDFISKGKQEHEYFADRDNGSR
ncbi:hypothetical protein N431DRAFT_433066 [Stipitochalara longipes BDJ]|nr:hypothetical protein N431DRAFT_433066 [Stipitochalara longipes BDJ]